MAQTATALLVAAIVSYGSMARGQPAIIGVMDADPPLDDAPVDVLAPIPPAPQLCVCNCQLGLTPDEATEGELTSVIVAGATTAIISYVFATVYASQQPHGVPTVDTIPIFGAIAAAQHNPVDDRTTPLLLFSAGVQAIGTLVAALAGAELAQRHRLLVDLGASSSGAGVALTWRY